MLCYYSFLSCLFSKHMLCKKNILIKIKCYYEMLVIICFEGLLNRFLLFLQRFCMLSSVCWYFHIFFQSLLLMFLRRYVCVTECLREKEIDNGYDSPNSALFWTLIYYLSKNIKMHTYFIRIF